MIFIVTNNQICKQINIREFPAICKNYCLALSELIYSNTTVDDSLQIFNCHQLSFLHESLLLTK